MTLKLGQNQKPNQEKFSLGLTVTPAWAELGLAQLKLVFLILPFLGWVDCGRDFESIMVK